MKTIDKMIVNIYVTSLKIERTCRFFLKFCSNIAELKTRRIKFRYFVDEYEWRSFWKGIIELLNLLREMHIYIMCHEMKKEIEADK